MNDEADWYPSTPSRSNSPSSEVHFEVSFFDQDSSINADGMRTLTSHAISSPTEPPLHQRANQALSGDKTSPFHQTADTPERNYRIPLPGQDLTSPSYVLRNPDAFRTDSEDPLQTPKAGQEQTPKAGEEIRGRNPAHESGSDRSDEAAAAPPAESKNA